MTLDLENLELDELIMLLEKRLGKLKQEEKILEKEIKFLATKRFINSVYLCI